MGKVTATGAAKRMLIKIGAIEVNPGSLSQTEKTTIL